MLLREVTFTDPRALTTGVTFASEGVYLLQLQAGGRGHPPAFASTVVTVEAQVPAVTPM